MVTSVKLHNEGALTLSTVVTVEKDDAANEVTRRWWAKNGPPGVALVMLKGDISKIRDHAFRTLLESVGGCHLMAMGPPCSNFAGRNTTPGENGRTGLDGPQTRRVGYLSAPSWVLAQLALKAWIDARAAPPSTPCLILCTCPIQYHPIPSNTIPSNTCSLVCDALRLLTVARSVRLGFVISCSEVGGGEGAPPPPPATTTTTTTTVGARC